MIRRPARNAGRRATDLLARSGAAIEALPAHLRHLYRRHALSPLHGSALYRWWLGRRGADREPRALPVAIVPGSADIARDFLTGVFAHDGVRFAIRARLANPGGS